MASKRKQINVRVDDAQEELIPRLAAAIAGNVGLAVTVSDLFRMGLAELARKYLPEQAAPAPPPVIPAFPDAPAPPPPGPDAPPAPAPKPARKPRTKPAG